YCGLFPDAPGFISSPAPEQDTGILLLMPGELPHCIEQMTALGPLEDKIKTVVICSKAMEEAAPVFFRQRAAACFPSDGTRHDLEQVLNEVALKGYCSNKLTFLSARHVDSGEADIIKRFASLNLTATERKVLRTLRDMPGSTRQQVAGAMNISLDTLQSHIRNINGKLGVKGHNAIEKVAEWIERG
ncbi:MAG: helix-turn-helix transcriptional regulator, partial [Hymenobacter sp.]